MNCEEPLSESGMTFGPFPDGYCFPIEKSAAYRKIKAHTKIAEFLLLRTAERKPPVIWVVEAKSSAPRPETQPNFGNFIDEIRLKLDNAHEFMAGHPFRETPRRRAGAFGAFQTGET